jgi:hypothetical protein
LRILVMFEAAGEDIGISLAATAQAGIGFRGTVQF